ncbi:MAG: 6-phosphogluconolactonase [Rhizomicrobium sp.]
MSNAASLNTAGPSFREFRNAEEMNATLAREIAERLTAAVAHRGHASMIASGGRTPGAMFDILARSEAPWKDIEITLSDDRWIETASERSNEKLIRDRLLVANAAAARFIALKTPHAHAQEAEQDVDDAVRAIHRPFDIALLGMGTDGHVASLIPGATGLQRALDSNDPALVRAVNPADLAAMGERMSLTLRAILDARWIVILLRGGEKREAYRWALKGTDLREAPVRALLHQSDVPVSVFWCP